MQPVKLFLQKVHYCHGFHPKKNFSSSSNFPWFNCLNNVWVFGIVISCFGRSSSSSSIFWSLKVLSAFGTNLFKFSENLTTATAIFSCSGVSPRRNFELDSNCCWYCYHHHPHVEVDNMVADQNMGEQKEVEAGYYHHHFFYYFLVIILTIRQSVNL